MTLVPGATISAGTAVAVPFGLPLPPAAVGDPALIRVLRDGVEIPAAVTELVRWRSLSGDPAVDSLRAVRIWVEVAFAGAPLELTIEYGRSRTLELTDPGDPRSTWVPIASGPDPDEYPAAEAILEPAVYAVYPPDWLGQCALRTRTVPVGNPGWAWFDDFLVGAARTAVNDLPADVPEDQHIDYLTDYSPWLFDRSLTLFGVYARTGDVTWMRRAHRATRFYVNHLSATGYFDLKGFDDLKYSYGQPLLVDLMLTGDTSLLAPIEAIASAGARWEAVYQPGRFWTERIQAYALLAALSAWEATGAESHGDRVRAIAAATFDMTESPASGWAPEGCPLHRFVDHEGSGGHEPICSPWMSALLADAVWRYHAHSGDPRALEFLAGLGEFLATSGLYLGQDGLERTVPYYLVSSVMPFSESGPWADMEHACDVWAVMLRGAWARRALGGDATAILAAASPVAETCRYNLEYWHRTSAGLPEYRLQPSRKFNWWFGTTLDLPWLAAELSM